MGGGRAFVSLLFIYLLTYLSIYSFTSLITLFTYLFIYLSIFHSAALIHGVPYIFSGNHSS